MADWDGEILAIELQALAALDFDIELTGFQIGEVEIAGNQAETVKSSKDSRAVRTACAVSRHGDLWLLGAHELRCGELANDHSYAWLDAAIRRWQSVSHKSATLADSGKTFAEIESERSKIAGDHSGLSQAPTKPEAAR